MRLDPVDPETTPAAAGGYAQAMQVVGATRLLYVSGQIPQAHDGTVPDGFDAQCRQAWRNVAETLAAAGLSVRHLVKVTTFLSDRAYRDANRAIRAEVLGEHRPALTVIVTDIYDEAWLLEIEAVAAA